MLLEELPHQIVRDDVLRRGAQRCQPVLASRPGVSLAGDGDEDNFSAVYEQVVPEAIRRRNDQILAGDF